MKQSLNAWINTWVLWIIQSRHTAKAEPVICKSNSLKEKQWCWFVLIDNTFLPSSAFVVELGLTLKLHDLQFNSYCTRLVFWSSKMCHWPALTETDRQICFCWTECKTGKWTLYWELLEYTHLDHVAQARSPTHANWAGVGTGQSMLQGSGQRHDATD